MQKTLPLALFILLLLSGCSSKTSPEAAYEKTGTVEHRVISVKEGGGEGVGAMIGSVVGSLSGNDRISSSIGTIVGGVAGAFAGRELSRYDSSELRIGLDDGDTVLVNTDDLSIKSGDRVKVVKEPNQFPKVEKIAY